MNLTDRLKELGWTLPPAPKPIAAYAPSVRSGNLLFISGQLPMENGKLIAAGCVPSVISVESAKKAAAQCAINALSLVNEAVSGDMSRVARVVRIGVFVQSDDSFHDQALVANGASELLQQIFGDAGKHARAAVGTNALPLNAAVEIEFIFELK